MINPNVSTCVSFDSLDRVVHVVGGTGGGREVIDLIHLKIQRINNVMVQDLKVLVANPLLNVFPASSEVIVSHKNLKYS